jgi:hypothetical protein
MTDSTQFPWQELLKLGAGTLGLLLLIVLAVKIAEWITSARDELRDRYVGGRWNPVSIDFIAMPIWIALEIFCFLSAIVFGLIVLLLAYQAAKDFRDWWHAGERGRTR